MTSTSKLEADLFSAPQQRDQMAFGGDASKDYATSSCPAGMGLNIMPSVGRFKDDQVQSPAGFMKGSDAQYPVHNASFSMAPKSNYGTLKDEHIQQNNSNIKRRPTAF